MRGASDGVVRWATLVLVACAAPMPARPPPEFAGSVSVEAVDLIDPGTFAARVASLRATLARSHVDLDPGPTVATCGVHHGIEDCFRCEIATRGDTGGLDPDMIDAISISFAMYPPSALAASHLRHVSLCRRIHYDHAHGDAVDPAGVAIYDDARLMISLEQFSDKAHEAYAEFTIEQVVHHELFHLFDRATHGEKVYADHDWDALNPTRFAYRDPAPHRPQRPRGFVDSYATTNELEDRASVYEYMMGHPDELCAMAAADPVVAAKAKLVRGRMVHLVGESKLPHCARKPAKKEVPLAPRPPSILGRMRG